MNGATSLKDAATGNAEALAARADRAELAVYTRLPFVPVRGEGCYLFDAAGKRYLDFYGGHAVAITGHSHPKVAEAIAAQARQLLFYSSAVLSAVRVEATELLLRHAPHPDSRVFHCVSGTEANEVAFKIARKLTGRRKIISFERSFHGRTLASLSAAGLPKYRVTAGPVLVPHHVHIPFGDEAALARELDGDTAGVICETIQSLAGIFAAPDAFYRRMAELTAKAGAVLIFDEIQTGFGRTGTYFFADGVGVKPDLITLAKGIASGIPAAAVIVAPHLAKQIGSGDQGTTFGGGPVAMAAMKATLEVIESEGLVENAARMGALLLRKLTGMTGIKAIRGKGLLLGLELDRAASPVVKALIERGVVAGTSSDPQTLRLLPPLIIGEAQVNEFVGTLTPVLSHATA
ncbi:MAG: aspartate aminotransferase family protein [Gemmatimonadetes bacterium]|nr:aspartate aminotransferase family protein [Gemmatimonadota bacterium]